MSDYLIVKVPLDNNNNLAHSGFKYNSSDYLSYILNNLGCKLTSICVLGRMGFRFTDQYCPTNDSLLEKYLFNTNNIKVSRFEEYNLDCLIYTLERTEAGKQIYG